MKPALKSYSLAQYALRCTFAHKRPSSEYRSYSSIKGTSGCRLVFRHTHPWFPKHRPASFWIHQSLCNGTGLFDNKFRSVPPWASPNETSANAGKSFWEPYKLWLLCQSLASPKICPLRLLARRISKSGLLSSCEHSWNTQWQSPKRCPQLFHSSLSWPLRPNAICSSHQRFRSNPRHLPHSWPSPTTSSTFTSCFASVSSNQTIGSFKLWFA